MGTNGAGLGAVGWRNELRSWEGGEEKEGFGRWVSPNFLRENTKHTISERPANVC